MNYKAILWIMMFCVLITSVSATFENVILYHSNDNADVTGTTIIDIGGVYLNNGTISAGVTTGGTGILEESFFFNEDTDDIVTIADHSSLDVTGAITISMWVNYSTALLDAGSSGLLAKHADAANGVYEMWVDDASGVIRFALNSADETVSTTSDLGDNQWHHIVARYNASAGKQLMELFVDGVANANTSYSTAISTNNEVLHIGRYYSSAADFLGDIDEVSLWARDLTNAEITSLYNSGNGYNPFARFINQSNFTMTARDVWSNDLINIFNASINGVNYNTTNGTIYTLIPSNSSTTYNLSVWAENYFNRTYADVNVSSNLEASLHQAEVCFNATSLITNDTVIPDNYTINTTGRTECFNISNGTYTVTANKYDWYSATLEFNISNYEQLNTTVTGLYSNNLTIYVKDYAGGDLDSYTVNISSLNNSWSDSQTITNHTFNLINGTYTVWINHPDYELANATINIINYTDAYVFTLYDTNSFNISVYKETNNSLLTGLNVTIDIIDSSNSYNYSTDTGTLYVTNLEPGEVTFRYSDVDGTYTGRSYFITINNQSHSNIRLYLLNDSLSSLITLDLVDQDGADVEDAIIKVQRFYASENLYRTIAMTKSNFNGQGSIDLVKKATQANVFYKFIVEVDGEVKQETSALEINPVGSDILYFSVNILEDIFTSWDGLDQISHNLVFVNGSAPYFSFTWSDTSGLTQYGCIKVVEHQPLSSTVICDNCTTSTSATIMCNVTDNGNMYLATGLIETTTNNSLYTVAVLSHSFDTKYLTFGLFGVFLAFLFIGTMASIGLWNPIVSIVLTLIAVIFSVIIGLVNLSYVSLVTLIIVGGIAIAKSRT